MMDAMRDLEGSFEKVEEIRRDLDPAEEKLETARARVWRVMGCPSLGVVRWGGVRFSRSMVIVGAMFGGVLVGAWAFTPFVGLAFAVVLAAAGWVWVKAKLVR